MGREAEMAVLHSGVDDAVRGRARFALLSGDPGIGKTRTAEEIAVYARTRGAQVLWGRCYEGEGAPPFWPWVQVLRAALAGVDDANLPGLLGDDGPYVAQLVPELRARMPEMPLLPASVSARDRQLLFESVGAFLRNISRARPLVIIVDDLQGADQPSALLVRFIVESLAADDALPVLLLGACRTAALERDSLLTDFLATLASRKGGSSVPLRGLTGPEVARFIEAHAGSAAPLELLPQLCAVTEGNPLFLKECAALLATAETAPTLTIPSTVMLIIQRRLATLTARCREVLAIAAAIGRDVPADILEQVATPEAPAVPTDDVVREAVHRAILAPSERAGTYRFAHALTRDALYAQLPLPIRPQVHRRIGEILARAPGLDERFAEVAYHFFQAGGIDDIVTAASYAHRGAERAVSVLAYEEALRLCETGLAALDRLGDGPDLLRCALLLTLAHAQKCSVDTETARITYQRAVELARRLHAPDLFARAVLGTFWRNEANTDARGVHLLEEALAALGEGDSVLRVKVLGQLANELLFDLETQARGREIGRAALAAARRLGDPEALCEAVVRWYPTSWRADNLDERLSAANELAHLGTTLGKRELAAHGSLLRTYCLFELGDLSGMDRELTQYGAYADELRQASRTYWVPFLRATRAILFGRFDEAERLANEALDIGQRVKEPAAFPFSLLQLFRINYLRGRLTPGWLDAATLVADAHSWNWGPQTNVIMGAIEVGGEVVARDRYERLARQDFRDVPTDTNWLNTLGNLALLSAHFNDGRRAAVVYPLLLPFKARNLATCYGAVCNGSAARYLGLLAATLARWDEATQHFENAIAHNAHMGARPLCAFSEFEYARMLLTRNAPGDRLKASGLLRSALMTASELGMAPLVAKAKTLRNDG